MTIFNYISAVLMLIIGLGLTHLLGDVVYAFQDRRSTRLDWLPFFWAAVIFVHQMQFLWAIYELKDLISAWTALKFSGLVLMALLLFVAGALVVPRDNEAGTDGWMLFLDNGRWSLAVLAIYAFLAYAYNQLFFGASWSHPANLINLLLCLLLIGILFTRTRKLWIWGSIGYAALSTLSTIISSPELYR